MPRSKSSQRWLQEHFEDIYVKKAQAEGYRSRAVYKLKEVDDKEQLLKPGMTIVDLGAAPGGWTQYAVEKLGKKGRVIALDCLDMQAVEGAEFILGDFREDAVLEALKEKLKDSSVDLVLSDMAPNMSGTVEVDIIRAMYLAELAVDFCQTMLKPGGSLFLKVFHGTGFEELLAGIRTCFGKVQVKKPAASRSRSRETYLLARAFRK